MLSGLKGAGEKGGVVPQLLGMVGELSREEGREGVDSWKNFPPRRGEFGVVITEEKVARLFLQLFHGEPRSSWNKEVRNQ